ncbi:hypothetical protein EYF80_001792 [Liparis tanakae]|uniref:Uncharacterized protein n=1 Tax=Liparis tanakae TaxID=230148 RepID=A0A4Z2JDV0_9TELE|nr:hypothetical protein EYF80_001792 [Liparis tanakae]
MALSFISPHLNRTANTPVGHERLGQPFWPNRRTSPSSSSREKPGCRRPAQLTGVNGSKDARSAAGLTLAPDQMLVETHESLCGSSELSLVRFI